MEIEAIGPWVLLAIGAAVLVIGAIKPHRDVRFQLLIGFVVAGTGVYGLAFLDRHGLWLARTLADLQTATTRVEAASAVDSLAETVASGRLPPYHTSTAMSVLTDYLRRPDLPDGFEREDAVEIFDRAMNAPEATEQGQASLQILSSQLTLQDRFQDDAAVVDQLVTYRDLISTWEQQDEPPGQDALIQARRSIDRVIGREILERDLSSFQYNLQDYDPTEYQPLRDLDFNPERFMDSLPDRLRLQYGIETQ